jgi:catechol 2,3-dioxygenase-like lactoylglutathione lyase family enzyme
MANDPLDALRLPVVPVEPRPEFAAALLRRIEEARAGKPWIEESAAERVPGAVERVGGGAATFRYFVDDIDAAVAFYCGLLGFEEELRSPPAFAMLYRGDLRLLLSVPGGPGRAHVMPDGAVPEPGGWNRISLLVPDLAAAVETLGRQGIRLRTDTTSGVGVRLALLQDPAGNPIELFEPLAGYHERSTPP